MRMTIEAIHFKHFKGFEDFALTLNGNNAAISGRNGAGKTSLADGFQWLFFGKNSRGSKLNPKPLDNQNAEKLGLNPTVEAQLIIDGKPITLTRIQEEKWATKRGELEAIRSSDTTKYFVDGVPTKEREWKEFLENLGGEPLLQMLSNSSFFMTLNWTNRREMLMALSGVTDETIIESNSDLQELQTILGERSIEDLKKILQGQKKSIKQEIEGLPARIQENTDTITTIQERIGDVIALEAELVHHNQQLSEAQTNLAMIKSGDATLVFQQELADLRLKLTDEKSKFLASSHLATESLQMDVHALENKIRQMINESKDDEYKISALERTIKDKQAYRQRMIAAYKEISVTTFDEHATVCPTCSQDLPSDQIEQLIEKFNIDKSNKLEANINEVEKEGLKKEVLAGDIARLDVMKKDLKNDLEDIVQLNEKLELLKKELVEAKSQQGSFEDTEAYQNITKQAAAINEKITNVESDSSSKIVESEQAVNELISKVADVQAKLQEQKTVDGLLDRINELKEKDGDLKRQNANVERQLWLIDEFTRIKVSSIEKSINEKFDFVQWKLFDVQKNGGIVEMCEATYNGVEYNSGLNNGARINSDLDIVNTLSKHFKLYLPVFIDNAESVNELNMIDSQMIELQVTEDDSLKVEV